jgi:tetratricopeptide (TPR) repeat protein
MKAVLLALLLVACGGGDKKQSTLPKKTGSGSSQDPKSMEDTGTPSAGSGATGMPAANTGGSGSGSGSQASALPPEPQITYPNLDPDPAAAKAQVDQKLAVAKAALSQNNPDGDGALAAAKDALKIDASNVDAAAFVAYAYYAKKQLDTSELLLDELFKRPSAKQNAMVFYVYGLVYDKTNRPDQAVLAYKQAVQLDPNLAGAWVNLGVHQLQNKQYQDAQATFEKLTSAPFNRADAITLTSLGSAYRGHAGDFPPDSGERSSFASKADAAYKRALQADQQYGIAYYNLGLLYLDFDSVGGTSDPLQRIAASEAFFNNYKNAPGVDMKLFDERMKDVNKAKKRAQKAAKGGKKGKP